MFCPLAHGEALRAAVAMPYETAGMIATRRGSEPPINRAKRSRRASAWSKKSSATIVDGSRRRAMPSSPAASTSRAKRRHVGAVQVVKVGRKLEAVSLAVEHGRRSYARGARSAGNARLRGRQGAVEVADQAASPPHPASSAEKPCRRPSCSARSAPSPRPTPCPPHAPACAPDGSGRPSSWRSAPPGAQDAPSRGSIPSSAASDPVSRYPCASAPQCLTPSPASPGTPGTPHRRHAERWTASPRWLPTSSNRRPASCPQADRDPAPATGPT